MLYTTLGTLWYTTPSQQPLSADDARLCLLAALLLPLRSITVTVKKREVRVGSMSEQAWCTVTNAGAGTGAHRS